MRTVQQIAKDNDLFRSTLFVSSRHKVVLTSGVSALKEIEGQAEFTELITKVRTFKTFTESNDPHGEHDFGKVVVAGVDYFWKIDYYDSAFNGGADPREGVTALLLTVMLADEY